MGIYFNLSQTAGQQTSQQPGSHGCHAMEHHPLPDAIMWSCKAEMVNCRFMVPRNWGHAGWGAASRGLCLELPACAEQRREEAGC